MFQSIRRTFFKIRLFIRAIRTGIMGIAVVVAAWIFLAPPSQTELRTLSLPQDVARNDPMLRAHRMAKVVSTIASERLYRLVAAQDQAGLTATQIRDNVEFAADGFGGFAAGGDAQVSSARGGAPTDGAKFISARPKAD